MKVSDLTRTQLSTVIQFFSHRDDRVGNGVCDTIMIHDNMSGSVLEKHPGNPCHGYMYSYHDNYRTKGMFTSVRCNRYKPDEPEYGYINTWVNFIVGPKSPWRTLPGFDRVEVVRDDIGRPLCIFVPIEDETRGQHLMNFLIATRYTYEKHNTKVPLFGEMSKLGMDDMEAFYLSMFCNPFNFGTYRTNPKEWMLVKDTDYLMHWFMNTWNGDLSSGTASFKRMLNADPKLTGHLWKINPNYKPIVGIWDGKKVKIAPFLKELFSEEKYTGSFEKNFKYHVNHELKFREGGSCRFENFVKKALDNRSQLYECEK